VAASREAAILVPLFARDGDAHVVLIERSRSSGSHRGEIAFPGGVLEPGESPARAAVREAHEEIGIPPREVTIVASLDAVPTTTAFVIWPHVGVLAGVPRFTPNPSEVERVITVPLVDLVGEDAQWWEPYGPSAVQAYALGDAVGWGTTASLLTEVLTAAADGRRRQGR
jgi:8-oxo-dGTP pyrophosphatase MutT (NUDIX family)